jgi:hypothetical protein
VKRDVVGAIESLLAHRTEDLGCYEFVLEAWMEEAASEINRLRSERRWIPAGERLPDEGEWVLWFNPNLSEPTCLARLDGESLDWGGDLCMAMRGFTHWMPLPEPPEVK